MRTLWLSIALTVAACGGAPGNKDGAESDAVVAHEPGAQCPNVLKPEKSLFCEGETPTCCLAGQLVPKPSCVADLQSCPQGSKWSCDDALDCGDDASCCWAETSNGTTGQCMKRCNLLTKPVCSGPGTCRGGAYCCMGEGDTIGSCVKDEASCDPTPDSAR